MLTISATSNADFELAPAGAFPAICYRIIDLGTQVTEYLGEAKRQRKLLVSWELPTEVMADGRPFAITKRFTMSLNGKSALRRDLEAWRGKPFSAADLIAFDLTTIIGKPVLLNIVHTDTERGRYANVGSLMPLPKGMPAPTPVNKPVIFDIDDPDMEVFASLSQRLQEQIGSAPEWKRGDAFER